MIWALLLIVAVVIIVAAAYMYTTALTSIVTAPTVTYDGAFDAVGLAQASLTAPFGGDFHIINPAVVATTISGGNATLQVGNGTSINTGTTFAFDLYMDINDPVQNLKVSYFNNYNETTGGASGNFTSTQIRLDSAALYNYDTGTLTSLKVGDFVVDTDGTATYQSGVLPAGAYVVRFVYKMLATAVKPQCGDEAFLGYVNARLTSTGSPKTFSNFNTWVAVTPAC